MKKERMILSEGFQGDRHVMKFEEAKQEVFDIASIDELDEYFYYLEDNPNATVVDFANFKKECFESEILNGYIYEYHGVTYQELDDETIEELWKELEDVIFFEDKDKNLVLVSDWFIFDKKEYRDDIWHWFDDYHSKGVGYLLNDFEG